MQIVHGPPSPSITRWIFWRPALRRGLPPPPSQKKPTALLAARLAAECLRLPLMRQDFVGLLVICLTLTVHGHANCLWSSHTVCWLVMLTVHGPPSPSITRRVFWRAASRRGLLDYNTLTQTYFQGKIVQFLKQKINVFTVVFTFSTSYTTSYL